MADPTSVSAAVEKMVKSAPTVKADAAADTSSTHTDETLEQNASASGEESSSSEDRTAFEQELIEGLEPELKKEFESLPVSDQKRMMTWMKRQYRSQAKSMTELGTHRKVMAALRDAGVTSEDLITLTKNKRNGATAHTTTSGDGKRGYERWRDKASTPEEREQLREAEQVQRELVEDIVRDILSKEVHPLRERLESSERQQLSERGQVIEQEINSLEDELGYPGSLIETHREAMIRLGLQEPRLSAEDLLVRVAGFQTVKSAMLKVAKTEDQNVVSTPRLGSPVVKKPVQEEPEKNSRGRASIRKFVDSMLSAKH